MNHNVFYRQETKPTYTYENKYPLSNMNPIERKTLTKVIGIDSLFRKNYNTTSSTDYTYILPENINNVIKMSISALEFPNAWYTFSNANQSNVFTITLYNIPAIYPTPITDINGKIQTPTNNVYPGPIINTITIPEGNYISSFLKTTINNLFTNTKNGLDLLFFDINEYNTHCVFRTLNLTDSTGGSVPANLTDVTMSGDYTNFHFTIDFRLQTSPNRPLFLNAGWMMGFRQPYYSNTHLIKPFTDNYSTTTSYTYHWFLISESSYGSSTQNYLYLEIDDFQKNSSPNTIIANSTNNTYLGNNIMGRISVTNGMNTIVNATKGDRLFRTREYFGPIKLEKLHIRLLDKFGNPVQLVNNDFSFALEVEQIYQ
jgi:hypothetical protein